MNSSIKYIDLFAGAGGLSEGFIREGFIPVAHVEMDKNACDTLKTRTVYHYLKRSNKLDIYYSYLNNEITRGELWNHVPSFSLNTVMNFEISNDNLYHIFNSIDNLLHGQNIDLIIGGPPCQAYSLVGRSRDPSRMVGDKRNFLFRYYAIILDRYKPEYFLFENVLGLLSAGNKSYLNEMLRLFRSIGYAVAEPTVLNAGEFGVLQKRKRVFIIGKRGDAKFEFPELNRVKNPWQVMNDLFYDLPKLKHGDEPSIVNYSKPINDYLIYSQIRDGIDFVTQHVTRRHNSIDLEIYSIAIDKWINKGKRLNYNDLPDRLKTHSNTNSFLDRFKVVDPNGLSHTMVAHISKDGHFYIYPDLTQVRSISVREAARIQSFPDDYFFEGGRTSAFKQIGNAVPPLMAQSIANKLKMFLNV